MEKLVTGLKNKTYKYTYENKNYTNEEVLQMTQAGDLKLRSCWKPIGSDKFRKIRSGIQEERSPIEQRDPRIKKFHHDV